jgi:hypothetical protein
MITTITSKVALRPHRIRNLGAEDLRAAHGGGLNPSNLRPSNTDPATTR